MPIVRQLESWFKKNEAAQRIVKVGLTDLGVTFDNKLTV